MPVLLAVDLGLRCGLALYTLTPAGELALTWYGSHHFRNRTALKNGARTLLRRWPDIAWLVVEGDPHLAKFWETAAPRTVTESPSGEAPKYRMN